MENQALNEEEVLKKLYNLNNKFPSGNNGVDENDFNMKPNLNPSVQIYMTNMGATRYIDDFDKFGIIPKILDINRVIDKAHVSKIETILENGKNIWNSIFVIKNKFNIKPEYFDDEQMKCLQDNLDGTYSIIDENSNIPKYVIVDGQHRFIAFKNKYTKLPYKDLSNSVGITDLDCIIDIVNDFNIGVKGFSNSTIKKKKEGDNPYLSYFNDITKNIIINVQNDKEGVISVPLNDSKSPYSTSYVTEGTKGFLKREITKHIKSGYICNDRLSPRLKIHIEDIVEILKMVNNVMEGHAPKAQIIHKFLKDLKSTINYENTSLRNFLPKLEKYLIEERDEIIENHCYNLNNKIEIHSLTSLLFGDVSYQVEKMLNNTDCDIKYYRNKYDNKIDI